MPIKAEQLQNALGRGLAPVYLFGGPEPLLVQECRDQLFAVAREQGFMEREIVHADARYDWERLGDSGGTGSLFSSRKIIDLRLPSGKPGQKGSKVLADWNDNADPDTMLVISCDQWDASARKSKWASSIDKAGVRVDIWPVGPRELPRWIDQRMKQRGLSPDRGAVLQLARRLEGNLLAAQQEIDKLVLLKGAGTVTENDILEAVADSARFDAFLLVERMLSGQLAASLRVVNGLERMGVAVQLLIGALSSELRTLEAFMRATGSGRSEADAFRKLNIWRSRQPFIKAAAARLDPDTLLDAFSTLSLIDRQGKGRAAGNPWHSLDQLVCRLCA